MKFTEEELAKLVDEPYLSRGREYFLQGMVDLLSINPKLVKAQSIGTRLYQVTLRQRGKSLYGTCSCPAFEDFGPCKHMAATGFALIQEEAKGYSPSEDYVQRTEFFRAFEQYLLKKSKEELVAFILQLSNDYPEVLDFLV